MSAKIRKIDIVNTGTQNAETQERGATETLKVEIQGIGTGTQTRHPETGSVPARKTEARRVGPEIVECVPNFSEGRRPEVIEAIVAAIADIPGVKVLDYSSDPDHNRMVVTFIGDKGSVLQGAFAGVAKAVELIDMEKHEGGHPRIGAADVVPFVPISGVDMKDCVDIAKRLGAMIGDKLSVPVYLYGEAAQDPARRDLANVRKGQYEGLKAAITDPDRTPDFGPPRMHPSAGATAVGARGPLVAYNINLGTRDVRVAKEIVKAVRAATGGFSTVKAMAVELEEACQVQVSMNLADCFKTPIHRVFEVVKGEAMARGVLVTKSEVIGLLPVQALIDLARYYIQAHDLTTENVLEARLLEE